MEFNSASYKPIIITIDGTAASGKGTIVKGVTRQLDERYSSIDAGAMYRGLTFFYQVQKSISPEKLAMSGELHKRLEDELELNLKENGQLLINGETIEDSNLRGPKIDPFVCKFSAIDEVKKYIIAMQSNLIKNSNGNGWILDGRCMGTAVAPQAQAKFFVDANPYVRATRRHLDYIKMGKDQYSTEDIFIDIKRRDEQDYNTTIAPLKKPEDSIEIDSFSFSPEAAIEKALKYIQRKMQEEGKA